MQVRCAVSVSLIYTCVQLLLHTVLSCVQLLNGWTPMSVAARADKADLCALGLVLRKFKPTEQGDETYTAGNNNPNLNPNPTHQVTMTLTLTLTLHIR